MVRDRVGVGGELQQKMIKVLEGELNGRRFFINMMKNKFLF